ncbi:hypothetical protein [Wolbachia endosymbiont of Cylisticus convexus]|uniref:hypothetical protein n=1 Tax=Wolbachia endosymbiont of Cylisticus convexus TaxID=118728 RepID=UPI0015D03B48|nr:hypothetical protein [Wolbachia endosymbiont of Cylisticus convexus]
MSAKKIILSSKCEYLKVSMALSVPELPDKALKIREKESHQSYYAEEDLNRLVAVKIST